jgi:electron transfer flavoprotein alpha subunit
MSTVLVYIESANNAVSKSALSVITAALQARSLHGYSKVTGVLLGGSEVESLSGEVAHYGLDEVLYVSSDALSQYLAPAYSEAMLKVCNEVAPDLVLAGASSRGKDFMPQVAYGLDAAQASDVTGFGEGGVFVRPMYAGNIIAEVVIESDKKLATIRQSAFDAPEKTEQASPVRNLAIEVSSVAHTEFVSFDTVVSERPELGDAEVVVSGGRALGSTENFEKILYPLADHLGAALGASRAAVDAGYVPNDWQVGQTGKIVAPKLYFAIGISGAVQHLAGMKDSKVIVAINKDEEAPIFEVADYGIVGDLFSIVPELLEKLKATS